MHQLTPQPVPEPVPAPAKKSPWQIALVVVCTIVALVAVKVGYDAYTEKYSVARRDDGVAVDRVIRATFSGANALKVGQLSGSVQSSATDVRGFGMLTSDKVIKAPFTVDYFVDLSRMSQQQYKWDAGTRTLTITAPDVTVAPPNVDESGATLSQTRGLFVTRDAAEALARQVSGSARSTATAEASKPERIAAARENARRALAKLLVGPLEVAGVNGVKVAVVFPYEMQGSTERWDTSRSVGEVLTNGN